MLIDSIMGTIDHIYCDNTFHVITEQNHRRNTIVRRLEMCGSTTAANRVRLPHFTPEQSNNHAV